MGEHSAIAALEAELKLLRWHKLANESALKAAIFRDRQVKRGDGVPRLMNESKARVFSAIKDERSKDLITDEAFVKRQQEYELKDEEAARRHTMLHAKRLRSIQMKAEAIREARSRKNAYLQIKNGSSQESGEGCTSKRCGEGSMSEGSTRDAETTNCQALVNFRAEESASSSQSRSEEHSQASLVRSQSCPAGSMTGRYASATSASAGGKRRTTKLHFTKLHSKSGPGEPSRPYYCVRVSQVEKQN